MGDDLRGLSPRIHWKNYNILLPAADDPRRVTAPVRWSFVVILRADDSVFWGFSHMSSRD